jgi:hypothetical protein
MVMKKLEGFCCVISDYQCPGFVDRSCSNRTTPPLIIRVGEKGGMSNGK